VAGCAWGERKIKLSESGLHCRACLVVVLERLAFLFLNFSQQRKSEDWTNQTGYLCDELDQPSHIHIFLFRFAKHPIWMVATIENRVFCKWCHWLFTTIHTSRIIFNNQRQKRVPSKLPQCSNNFKGLLRWSQTTIFFFRKPVILHVFDMGNNFPNITLSLRETFYIVIRPLN
jgi:hypothetical protein